MLIRTRDFGEFEVDSEEILYFEQGIPGFETEKEFVLLVQEGRELPFMWLQSVNNPKVCFIVVDPYEFIVDYKPQIPDYFMSEIAADTEEDIRIIVIATIPERISDTTLNLRSPIIININNHMSKQLIQESPKYPLRHRLFDSIGG